MSLKIRLARGGTKKRPYYRIVVSDARAPRDGRFIEKIGTYNPMVAKDSAERVTIVTERAQRNNPEKAVPGKKAQERAAEKAKKAEAAAE